MPKTNNANRILIVNLLPGWTPATCVALPSLMVKLAVRLKIDGASSTATGDPEDSFFHCAQSRRRAQHGHEWRRNAMHKTAR
jgi:hypothetical protein